MRSSELGAIRNDFVRHGLRFSQVRLMVALMETEQISAAAAQLGITQPAASRLLTELERLTGTALYTRHSRGVTLTEAGKRLAQKSRAVLHLLDDAQTEVSELASGTRGDVRIGSVTGPALELVLPVIREMREACPEIQFTVVVDTSDKLADGLINKTLDFYIGRLHGSLDRTNLDMQVIGSEPVSLIVRPDHPLTRRDSLSLMDCLGFDWVMQPTNGLQRRTMETYLLENGYPLPDRVIGTTSLLLTLALIADSNAIAPMSSSVAQFYAGPDPTGARIRILNLGIDIKVTPYSLIRLQDNSLSAAAERVMGLVRTKISGRNRPPPKPRPDQ